MKKYLTSRPAKILLAAKIISTLVVVTLLSGCNYAVKVKDLNDGKEKSFNVNVTEDKENTKEKTTDEVWKYYENDQFGIKFLYPSSIFDKIDEQKDGISFLKTATCEPSPVCGWPTFYVSEIKNATLDDYKENVIKTEKIQDQIVKWLKPEDTSNGYIVMINNPYKPFYLIKFVAINGKDDDFSNNEFPKIIKSIEVLNDVVKSNANNFEYINSQYGFNLTFPSSWKGYLTQNRTLEFGDLGTSDSIDFGLPAQKGLFNISFHAKEQWKSFANEEGSMPVKLGENEQYVFGWAQSQYTANSEMEKRYAEIPAIIKTFTLEKTSNNEVKKTETSAEKTSVSGEIDWISPTPIASLNLFAKDNPSFMEEGSHYYLIGKAKSGKYSGGDLVLVSAAINGPALYPDYLRFIKKDNQLTLLRQYTSEYFNNNNDPVSAYQIDYEYRIKSLEYPETINGPKARQKLALDPNVNALFEIKNLKIAFTDSKLGTIYTTADETPTDTSITGDVFTKHGFYLKALDGTAKVYKLEIDFLKDYNLPQITWNNGAENDNQYNPADKGGCGDINYISVMNPAKIKIEKDLKETGKTINGDKIYELKDTNNEMLKNIYDEQYTMNNQTGEPLTASTKLSYEKFAAAHPIFFWVDPFGRLIKFENMEFMPAAECGKPVIYLYPEKTTEVNVKVSPTQGFSYTEPLYPDNKGWTVLADTESNLTEISTGKVYPYLFWEGRGGIYNKPDKGWVIEQKEVHNFLIEKLAKLGLNRKETADFIEFWEPKMQDSPYYFITFFGNQTMNQIAPLEVTPKPDTVIRILMDFQGLKKPIKAEGYEIKTPERKGFTVVEWGGVLK